MIRPVITIAHSLPWTSFCLHYFCINLIIYQRNLSRICLIWPYSFKSLESMMVEQGHGGRRVDSLYFDLQIGGRERDTGN